MERRIPDKLTPTSIDTWRMCPRRFAFSYLKETDGRIVKPEDSESYEQILGTVVHRVLETLLKVAPERRVPEAIQRAIEWSALRFGSQARLDESQMHRLRDETDRLVVGYLAVDGANARPIALERTFELRLTNGTTIRTRVDRIDRRGTDEEGLSPSYEIVDYKTGRQQLEARDLAWETAPIVQLNAVSRATDAVVDRVTWLYLRSGESITWSPEEEDVETATERLIDVVKQMHADRRFEPSPGAHCLSCPHNKDCPAWSTADKADSNPKAA